MIIYKVYLFQIDRLEEEEYEDMLQKEAEKITVRDAYATPPTVSMIPFHN